MCRMIVYFCMKCNIEFYGDRSIAYCPICSTKLEQVGDINISELEGIFYILRYVPNGNMREKIRKKKILGKKSKSDIRK